MAAKNLHLEWLDVKTAFLHGDLKEDIYMLQPHRHIILGKEQLVCKLKKSLYDLKQALRHWYLKFDKFTVVVSQDWRFIIAVILSGLRILILYYCCTYMICLLPSPA